MTVWVLRRWTFRQGWVRGTSTTTIVQRQLYVILMKNYQFQSYCAKCNDRKHIFNICENESTTFDLISVKTVTFRRKGHRYKVVENLIIYFFYTYTFYPSDAPFWRKNRKYEERCPPKGGFPPKKGGSTHLMEGNSLDLSSMTLEEYSCQI